MFWCSQPSYIFKVCILLIRQAQMESNNFLRSPIYSNPNTITTFAASATHSHHRSAAGATGLPQAAGELRSRPHVRRAPDLSGPGAGRRRRAARPPGGHRAANDPRGRAHHAHRRVTAAPVRVQGQRHPQRILCRRLGEQGACNVWVRFDAPIRNTNRDTIVQPVFPNEDVVRFLLEGGIEVDTCNQNSATPLHVACMPYNYNGAVNTFRTRDSTELNPMNPVYPMFFFYYSILFLYFQSFVINLR